MKVAIMQPYFFPYIGYFQLINSIDIFVFLDNVNYMKKSWINRNYILLNGQKHLLTIPCQSVSQNKEINLIQVDNENKAYKNILKTIEVAYRKKASYYDSVFPIINNLVSSYSGNIAGLSMESVVSTCRYLGINTKFLVASEDLSENTDLGRSERMISICKTLGANELINAIGGIDIYDRKVFDEHGIQLSFIRMSKNLSYSQGKDQPFISNLSIIDVMMFNSTKEISQMLESCEFL